MCRAPAEEIITHTLHRHRKSIAAKRFALPTMKSTTTSICIATCLAAVNGYAANISKGAAVQAAPQRHLSQWPSIGTAKAGKLLDYTLQFLMDGLQIDRAKAAGTLGLVIALGLLLIVWMLLRWTRRAHASLDQNSQITENEFLQDAEEGAAPAGADELEVCQETCRDPQKTIERLVELFLSIFEAQNGAAGDVAKQYKRVESTTEDGGQVFELRIKLKSGWKARRMSIGPLGDATGSNSQCFHVIFDTPMVVKIPSQPITDYQGYLDAIQRDRRIVSRLSPRECIVPKVSVVLQKVFQFPNANSLNHDQLEQKYIHWVKKYASFQNYLKIGKSFIFFMDLSAHYFLGHIINDIHEIQPKVADEILHYPDLLWDQDAFMGRYGTEAQPICARIQEVFTLFEDRVRDLTRTLRPDMALHTYQTRRWFLSLLAGKPVAEVEHDLDREFCRRIDTLLAEIRGEYALQVDTYRETISAYIRRTTQRQLRSRIENISWHILELLAWLRQRRVVLRDIKPENLFVVGTSDAFPEFLESHDRFHLGVIDVETAIWLDQQGSQESVPQPKLGGTPAYMTPSHLIDNATISAIYDDVGEILLLQDSFAVAAMIFKVVTGNPLFVRTPGLFPAIGEAIGNTESASSQNSDNNYIKASWLFWSSAISELRERRVAFRAVLNDTRLRLPPEVAEGLIPALHSEILESNRSLQELIDTQRLFASEEKRRELRQASTAKLAQLRKQWEDGNQIQSVSVSLRNQVVDLLWQIETLKEKLDQMALYMKKLKRTEPEANAGDVVEMLIHAALAAMHRPQWKALSHGAVQRLEAFDEDGSYESTI